MSQGPNYTQNHSHNPGWIHELARGELNPELDAIKNLNGASPQQKIEESTIDFLTDMRGHIQESLRAFNAFSESGKRFQEIKVFNLAQTASDFMLYRNGVKLIFANTSHGVIEIHFSKHQPQAIYPNSGSTGTGMMVDSSAGLPGREEVIANVGVFGRVNWTCRGESVSPQEVSQHFFSEFVRMTREERSLKPNQAQLLTQIRSLLKEQGLDL